MYKFIINVQQRSRGFASESLTYINFRDKEKTKNSQQEVYSNQTNSLDVKDFLTSALSSEFLLLRIQLSPAVRIYRENVYIIHELYVPFKNFRKVILPNF